MRERFNAQVSNRRTKSAITMDSSSDASMRRSVRQGTICKSFWNPLCSFLALHLRGIRQPEINKTRLEWTGKWVSLPRSPHPHPYEVYHPQSMLAYYTWHALFYRNVIHGVLRDLPHGWAGMIRSIENGWQDYGLMVFSSLQAWECWLGHYGPQAESFCRTLRKWERWRSTLEWEHNGVWCKVRIPLLPAICTQPGRTNTPGGGQDRPGFSNPWGMRVTMSQREEPETPEVTPYNSYSMGIGKPPCFKS